MNFNNLNPELNVKKVGMTSHAYERAAERFDLKIESQALGYFRNLLKKAKKIGETVDDEGYPSVLYAYNKAAVYLTLDLKVIKSVRKIETLPHSLLKDNVVKLHEKEIRKLTRAENAQKRRVEAFQLDLDIEVAMLKRRIHRTRSEAVKKSCEARIKALHKTLEEKKKEVKDIQDEKRRVANSMVSLI